MFSLKKKATKHHDDRRVLTAEMPLLPAVGFRLRSIGGISTLTMVLIDDIFG